MLTTAQTVRETKKKKGKVGEGIPLSLSCNLTSSLIM